MTLLLYTFVCDSCDGVVMDDTEHKHDRTTEPMHRRPTAQDLFGSNFKKLTLPKHKLQLPYMDPWMDPDDDLIDEDPPDDDDIDGNKLAVHVHTTLIGTVGGSLVIVEASGSLNAAFYAPADLFDGWGCYEDYHRLVFHNKSIAVIYSLSPWGLSHSYCTQPGLILTSNFNHPTLGEKDDWRSSVEVERTPWVVPAPRWALIGWDR